jgi:hypothetical protein
LLCESTVIPVEFIPLKALACSQLYESLGDGAAVVATNLINRNETMSKILVFINDSFCKDKKTPSFYATKLEYF